MSFSSPKLESQADQKSRDGRSNHSVVDFIGLAILTLTAVVTPWCFGGVMDKTQSFVWAWIVLALLVWWAQVSYQGIKKLVFVPIMIPVFLALLLVMGQLVPLPNSIRSILSPKQTEIIQNHGVEDALGTERAEELSQQWRPITLSTSETKRTLRLLTLCVACFFLATQVFRSRDFLIWFAGINAVNGAALACFGILQMTTFNGKLYWVYELTRGGQPFASFVNRNNAGGYLLLALACAFSICFWAYSKRQKSTRVRESTYNELTSPLERVWFLLRWFVAELTGFKLFVVILTILISVGLIATSSRGTFVALVFAIIISGIFILFAGVKKTAVLTFVVVFLVAAGGVVFSGFNQKLFSRFDDIDTNTEISQDTRVQLWYDSMSMGRDFAITGSGVGTYKHLHSAYLQRNVDVTFVHAENQFVEAFVEAGVLGVILILVCIGLVGYSSYNIINGTESARNIAIGVLGIFAVSATASQNFFDFGLYAPSNSILLAIIVGGVCASDRRGFSFGKLSDGKNRSGKGRRRRISGKSKSQKSSDKNQSSVTWKSAVVLGLGVCLLFFSFISAMRTFQSSTLETALLNSRFGALSPDSCTAKELDTAIKTISSSPKAVMNAESYQHLGKLYELKYQRENFRLIAKQSEKRMNRGRAKAVWPKCSFINFHKTFALLRNDPVALNTVRKDPNVKNNLELAFKAYTNACLSSPIAPLAKLRLCYLSTVFCDAETENKFIASASGLAPNNARQQFVCGSICFNKMNYEQATEYWTQALLLDSELIGDIIEKAKQKISPNIVAEKILRKDPELILQVAEDYYQNDEDFASNQVLLNKAIKLIEGSEEDFSFFGNESEFLLANAYFLTGKTTQGIELLKQVLLDQPKHQWRFRLAEMYESIGDHPSALSEISECIKAAPLEARYETYYQTVHKSMGFKDRKSPK